MTAPPSRARRSARRPILVLAVALAAALALDLSRPPDRQWTTHAALHGIALYQRIASPWISAAGVSCRFTPTCSRYAAQVIARDGALSGGWKSAVRIVRCGPWTPAGTVDEP